MKMGSKSLLLGAHQFILHPIMMLITWWRLFGAPLDPRLWIAFFVHDLGYWGCATMDGKDGERHVEIGAEFMRMCFGERWYEFMLYHSRFYARQAGKPISRLCVADKYVIATTPWWLYLPLVRLTGEIREYQAAEKHVEEIGATVMDGSWASDRDWYRRLQVHMQQWTIENKQIAIEADRVRFGL